MHMLLVAWLVQALGGSPQVASTAPSSGGAVGRRLKHTVLAVSRVNIRHPAPLVLSQQSVPAAQDRSAAKPRTCGQVGWLHVTLACKI